MSNVHSTMAQQLERIEGFFAVLHEDERGDNENLGRLLILALVLIPLIILIAFFGKDILDRADKAWTAVIGKEVKKGGAGP